MTIVDVEQLENAVGGSPEWALGKVIFALEDHALRWVRSAPLVALAVDFPPIGIELIAVGEHVDALPDRVEFGPIHDAFVGERPAATLWMLPGIEDTLRINGLISCDDGRLQLQVEQAFFHCAKAFKRSGLWQSGNSRQVDVTAAIRAKAARNWTEIVDGSTFAFLATSDGQACHVSPRGDPSGSLLKVVDDGAAILMAERPGNRMAACMHQILDREAVSLLVLDAPGSTVVTIRGDASLHADAELRSLFRHNSRDPRIVVRVAVTDVVVSTSSALSRLEPFNARNQAQREQWPSLARMMGDQIAGRAVSRSEVDELAIEIETDYRDNLY